MTSEEFVKIITDTEAELGEVSGCNALAGLKIINSYLPTSGIEGAGHDMIYSANVNVLVEAGITQEDAVRLGELNWMIEDGEYLACFV